MNPQTLPNRVLSDLFCRQCYRYLSVGPVTNNQSKPVCGRCNTTNPKEGIKSLWNTLSDGFKFKCSNCLNGCKEILSPAEMALHEPMCEYRLALDECSFCGLRGNVLQMFFHLKQEHSDGELQKGMFSLLLTDQKIEKTLWYFLPPCNMYYVAVELSATQFSVSVQPFTNPQALTLKSYLLKLATPGKPLNSFYIINTCGVNENVAKFETSRDQLIDLFGLGTAFGFELIIKEIALEAQEQEVLGRYQQLLVKENLVNISQQAAKSLEVDLKNKTELYDKVFKMMLVMFDISLKCRECLEIYPAEMYYCSNHHCYCKNCMTSICTICNYAQKYVRLPNMENFTLMCKNPECKKVIKLTNYAQHRTLCVKRLYRCPLLGCNTVIDSAQKLFEHWHSAIPALHWSHNPEEYLTFQVYRDEEFYWLVQDNLYHVLLRFKRNDIEVLIMERSVMSSNIKLTCQGSTKNYAVLNWHDLPKTNFCGKFRIKTNENYLGVRLLFEEDKRFSVI